MPKIIEDLNAIIEKLEAQQNLKLELSEPHKVSSVFADIAAYLQQHRDVAADIKMAVEQAKKDLEVSQAV